MSLKKLIDRVNMIFPSPAMEREYATTKRQTNYHQFQITIVFLILINLLIFIPAATNYSDDIYNFYIGLVFILILVFMYLIKSKFRVCIQYLTLLALIIYIVSRLLATKFNYDRLTRVGQFFQGYMFASIQCIVISRIQRVDTKVITIIISLTLRFTMLYTLVDPNAFNYLSLIRQILIDGFFIYVICTVENSERKVFQNYYEKNEELVKFKELLDDSLPQSVTIIECGTFKTLFSNKTFLRVFDQDTGHCPSDYQGILQYEEKFEEVKPSLHYLSVDLTTLRDIGSGDHALSTINCLSDTFSVKDLLDMLEKNNALEGKTYSVSAHFSHQKKRISFEITLKKVKWDRLNAVAIILNDITYQENLIALKTANLNKDKMIATVSHELRTPLHGIIGILEMTEARTKDETVLENLMLCEDNANLLLSLVNSLLDLHQISTGKLSLNISRIDLHKVFREILRLFQFQCNEKDIYLELSIGEDVPQNITTDENRLKQILIGLIGNAVKFTSIGGIRVEVIQDLQESSCLVVSVTDTGIGIKKDDQAKLFTMNGKAGDGESTNKHGVGLGLTVSNALALMLQGDLKETQGIKVVSTEGIGSTFEFRILKELGNQSQSQVDLNMSNSFEKVEKEKIEKKDKFEKQKKQHHTIFSRRGTSKQPEFLAQGESQTGFRSKADESISSIIFEESMPPLNLEFKLASYVSLKRVSSQISQTSISKLLKFGNKDDLESGRAELQPGLMMNQLRELPSPENKKKTGKEVQTQQKERIDEKPANASNGHILVVDDNPFNLHIASSLIKGLGYEVTVAREGQQAINVMKNLAKEQIQLKVIFMDCQMPIMDGYETTQHLVKLMQEKEIQTTPIIAWTANNSQEDIQRCYDCGMQGHLAKPTSKETLEKLLMELK